MCSIVCLGECPICFDSIDMKNIAVTECGHMFHSTCIFRNLELRIDCPMCRHPLVDVDDGLDDSFMSRNGGEDGGEDNDDADSNASDWETVSGLGEGDDYDVEDGLGLDVRRNLFNDFDNVANQEWIKFENDQMASEDVRIR